MGRILRSTSLLKRWITSALSVITLRTEQGHLIESFRLSSSTHFLAVRPSFPSHALNVLTMLHIGIIEESIMDGEVAHVTLDARANLLLIQHNHEGVSMDLDDDDEEMVDDDIDIEEVDE